MASPKSTASSDTNSVQKLEDSKSTKHLQAGAQTATSVGQPQMAERSHGRAAGQCRGTAGAVAVHGAGRRSTPFLVQLRAPPHAASFGSAGVGGRGNLGFVWASRTFFVKHLGFV